MANITLSIPDVVKRKMNAHPNVKWSNAVRTIILQKLEDFEMAEKLVKKSRLTKQEAARLAGKINQAMGKRAEELLHEHYSRR